MILISYMYMLIITTSCHLCVVAKHYLCQHNGVYNLRQCSGNPFWISYFYSINCVCALTLHIYYDGVYEIVVFAIWYPLITGNNLFTVQKLVEYNIIRRYTSNVIMNEISFHLLMLNILDKELFKLLRHTGLCRVYSPEAAFNYIILKYQHNSLNTPSRIIFVLVSRLQRTNR